MTIVKNSVILRAAMVVDPAKYIQSKFLFHVLRWIIIYKWYMFDHYHQVYQALKPTECQCLQHGFASLVTKASVFHHRYKFTVIYASILKKKHE